MPTRKAQNKTTKQGNIFTKTNKQMNNNNKNVSKFTESYTSLILGIVVVIIATVLLLSFARNKNIISKTTNNNTKTVAIKAEKTEEVKKVPNNEQKKETKSEAAKVTNNPEPTKIIAKNNLPAKINGSSYTVQPGDNLWKIAENKYKSGYNWVDIAQANHLTNPGTLYKGMKLTLPQVSPKLATVTEAPQKATPIYANQIKTQAPPTTMTNTNKITGTSYTIQKGDTLWSIAVRAYGDGYQWTKIAQANNLLNNPGLIHSGNALKIPRE